MSDFERAILVSFDPGASAALKDEAQQFLAAARQAPKHVNTCFDAVEWSQRPEVKFWCLKEIQSAVSQQWLTSLGNDEREGINDRVLAWAFDAEALCARAAAFVQNKVAQLLTSLAAAQYPDPWPDFFQRILPAVARGGVGEISMFLRVLAAIDDDIISLDIPRSETGARQSMAFKDAMRERDIADIAASWPFILARHRVDAPELACLCLKTMQRYVNWIDIHLVARQDLVQMILECMAGSNAELQAAAADAMSEIVAKRMEPQPKLALIQQLGVLPVASSWSRGLPAVDGDTEIAAKLCSLLNTLAGEVIDSLKRIENQVVSMQALAVQVDSAALAEASTSAQLARDMLDQLLPAVLRTLRYEDSGCCLAPVPFLSAYLSWAKNLASRNSSLDEKTKASLYMIIQGIVASARYPDSCSVPAAYSTSGEESLAAEEQESDMEAKRLELAVLLRNAARLLPGEALRSAFELLSSTLEPARRASVCWQDVELAVMVLYELGEAVPDELNSPDCGTFRASVTLLLSSDVPHHEHRLVASSFLECCVRFVRVAAQNKQLVPNVMRSFLGSCGLGHAHQGLATRACYLLMRIVKVLCSSLKDYLGELIQGLIPRVHAIIADPISEGSGALKGTQGRGAPGATVQVDDRLYAVEALSMLLASDDVDEDDQAAHIQSVLSFIWSQINGVLESDVSNIEVMGSSPPPPVYRPFGAPVVKRPSKTAMISQALEAIARLSKGFSHKKLTRLRPRVGEAFKEALAAALCVPERLPRNKLLRSRIISLLHRLTEGLGSDIIPVLPRALRALLHDACDLTDVTDALRLVHQLVSKFSNELSGLLDALLPRLVLQVHAYLPMEWDWSGATVAAQRLSPSADAAGNCEFLRERGELQLAYHALISAVVSNGLLASLHGEGAIHKVLDATLLAAATHVDMGSRKLAINVLSKILETCKDDPSFESVAIHHFGCRCCIRGVLSGVDVRDGATLGVLNEVGNALKLLRQLYGEKLLTAVRNELNQAQSVHSKVSHDKWSALLDSIDAEDVKAIKEAFKLLLRQKQGVHSRFRPNAT